MRLVYQGKVRDVYEIDQERLFFVATDRVSAFDFVLPDLIPDKGKILTQLSRFWFEKTKHITAHHMLPQNDGGVAVPKEFEKRCMLVRRAQIFPYEIIIRAHLAGSAWKFYKRSRERLTVGAHRDDPTAAQLTPPWIYKLPDGMRFGEALKNPELTPTTKETQKGKHDEEVMWELIEAHLGDAAAQNIRRVALEVFSFAYSYLKERGLVLVDTKFEFGRLPDGQIVLCDEVLTPDCSRFWWLDEFKPGVPMEPLDKQQIRNYLEQTLRWDRTPPAPHLSPEIIAKTRQVYCDVFKAITGEEPEF